MLLVRRLPHAAGGVTGMIACVLVLAGMAPAGTPPVTATSAVSVKQLRVGESAEVAVSIEIAAGWHINAAEPGLSFLIPTSLEFELPSGVSVADVRYPKPETRTLKLAGDKLLRLYRGAVTIRATLVHGAMADRSREPIAVLRYQACNDTVCLRPASLKLPLPVEFSASALDVLPGDEKSARTRETVLRGVGESTRAMQTCRVASACMPTASAVGIGTGACPAGGCILAGMAFYFPKRPAHAGSIFC